MEVNPRVSFYVGIVVTVATGIGGGTVHLTNMLPERWIPVVVAWNAFVAFVGSAFMTAAAGLSSRDKGPLVK